MRISSLLLVIAIWTCVFAQVANAQFNTAGVGKIHVQSFQMWDDNGFNYEFGLYDSGLNDCESMLTAPFTDHCEWNGYIHVDWSTPPTLADTGIYATYWFNGPAFDQQGNPIPGTEDDFVHITAEIVAIGITNTTLYDFKILNLTIDESSNGFANGAPVAGLSLDFDESEDVVFGQGILDFFGPTIGSIDGMGVTTKLIVPVFDIHYLQSVDGGNFAPRDIVPIPAPEPGFAVGIGISTVALAALTTRRKERKALCQ